MKAYLLAFLTSALAFAAATFIVNGLDYGHNYNTLLKISLIFGLLEIFARPLIKILLLPLNFLTMGLLSGITGVVILYLMSLVNIGFSLKDTTSPAFGSHGVSFPSYHVGQIFTLLIGALVISIISAILYKFIK